MNEAVFLAATGHSLARAAPELRPLVDESWSKTVSTSRSSSDA